MSDTYHHLEIEKVTKEDCARLTEDLAKVDTKGITVCGYSWSPDTGKFIVDCGGPDISKGVENLRAQIVMTLGKEAVIDSPVAKESAGCRTGTDRMVEIAAARMK